MKSGSAAETSKPSGQRGEETYLVGIGLDQFHDELVKGEGRAKEAKGHRIGEPKIHFEPAGQEKWDEEKKRQRYGDRDAAGQLVNRLRRSVLPVHHGKKNGR